MENRYRMKSAKHRLPHQWRERVYWNFRIAVRGAKLVFVAVAMAEPPAEMAACPGFQGHRKTLHAFPKEKYL